MVSNLIQAKYLENTYEIMILVITWVITSRLIICKFYSNFSPVTGNFLRRQSHPIEQSTKNKQRQSHPMKQITKDRIFQLFFYTKVTLISHHVRYETHKRRFLSNHFTFHFSNGVTLPAGVTLPILEAKSPHVIISQHFYVNIYFFALFRSCFNIQCMFLRFSSSNLAIKSLFFKIHNKRQSHPIFTF